MLTAQYSFTGDSVKAICTSAAFVGQCPLERSCIRAVSTWLRAARDQRRETLPGLFQQLRVIYDSTCQGRREEGGWRVNSGQVRGYFSACQPSQPASFYFLPFFKMQLLASQYYQLPTTKPRRALFVSMGRLGFN